jgi:hypothetical protein
MFRDAAAGNGASWLERGDAPAPARQKSQTARERARRVIVALYPGGVPDQATLPAKDLCERINTELKEMGLRKASPDSILRAAGRRKDRKYRK